jgi:serine/threonine protein kinase
MSAQVQPYVDWLELPPELARPNYYELLGIKEFESDERKIKGGYYRRVARVSIYQNGPTAETCMLVLTELAEARDCLVDPDSRAIYDETLRRKVGRKTVVNQPLGKSPLSGSKTASLDSVKGSASSDAKTTLDVQGRNSQIGRDASQEAASMLARNIAGSPTTSVRALLNSVPSVAETTGRQFTDGNSNQTTANRRPKSTNGEGSHGNATGRNVVSSKRSHRTSVAADRPRSPFDMLSVMRTPEEIIAEVVATRGLTPYQAARFMERDFDTLVIGPYLIESSLGEGTWGPVHFASRVSTGELASVRSVVQSLREEQRALKKIVHTLSSFDPTKFQRAIDCGSDGDRCYLASEYVPGEDLKSLVERIGPLSPQQAVYSIARAVEALSIANQAGFAHLELRPSKILINRNGDVRIRDLAIANVVSERKREISNLAQLVQVLPIEHLRYLAPETLVRDSSPNFLSDIYSLGCVLYFLLTGEPVFPSADPMRAVLAHRESPVPNLIGTNSSLPDGLQLCFHKMMAKKPSQRFANYGELHQSLKQVYNSFATAPNVAQMWEMVDELSPLDVVQRPPLRRLHTRRALTTCLTLVTSVTALAVGGVYMWPKPDPIITPPKTELPEAKKGPLIIEGRDSSTVPEVEAYDEFIVR